MAQSIGQVSFILGNVKAVDSSGNERVLDMNSSVFHGETIVTEGADSRVVIMLENGQTLTMGRNDSVTLDPDVYDPSASPADAAQDNVASVQDIQEALLNDPNFDPTELEATAAGGGNIGDSSSAPPLLTHDLGSVEFSFLETEGPEAAIIAAEDQPDLIVPIVEEAIPEPEPEPEPIVIPPSPSPVIIPDPVVANLTLSGPDSVIEGETTSDYTLSVDIAPVSDLSVSIVTGHITTEDGDYIPVSTTVIIPAGQTSASFTVDTIDDPYADSGEEYTASIAGTTGGGYDSLLVTNGTVITQIIDDSTPSPPENVEPDQEIATLSIVGPEQVLEGNTTTDYTVSVDIAPETDLIISVVTGHVTTQDGDYVPVSTLVTIPAGETSAILSVQTIDDPYADNGEQFTVSITGASGGNYENLTLGNTSVTTTIIDDSNPDTPDEPDQEIATLSIAGPAVVLEGQTTADYTVSVDIAPETDLIVSIETGHITTENGDYIPVFTDVTIAAGSTSTTLTVKTINDSEVEVNEDFKVSITGSQGGNYENLEIGNSSVTTTIIDNDLPPPPPSDPLPTVMVDIEVDPGAEYVVGGSANATSINVIVTAPDGTVMASGTEFPAADGSWSLDVAGVVFDEETDYTVNAVAKNDSGDTAKATDVDAYDLLPIVTADIEVDPEAEYVNGTSANATSIDVIVTAADGTVMASGTEIPASDGSWSLDVSAVSFDEETDYTVTAVASDAAGNEASATDVDAYDLLPIVTADIEVDPEAEYVNGTSANATSIDVIVTAPDGTIVASGIETPAADGSWILDVSGVVFAEDVVYKVTAVASDAVGNEAEATDIDSYGLLPTVTTDIEVDPDAEYVIGTTTNATSIAAAVTDPDGAIVTSGIVTPAADGSWTLDVSSIIFSEETDYTVTAIASDAIGNEAIATDVDAYDLLPIVTADIEVDPEAEYVNGSSANATSIDVIVTAPDGTVMASGTETPASNGSWDLDVTGVVFDENVIYTVTAVASDAVGNEATATDDDSYDINYQPSIGSGEAAQDDGLIPSQSAVTGSLNLDYSGDGPNADPALAFSTSYDGGLGNLLTNTSIAGITTLAAAAWILTINETNGDYVFTQIAAYSHAAGEDSGLGTVTITITDSDGEQDFGNLELSIIDDEPSVSFTDAISPEIATVFNGTWSQSTGGDIPAESTPQSIIVNSVLVDNVGATNISFDFDADFGTGNGSFDYSGGTVNFELVLNTNGTYTLTLDAQPVNVVIDSNEFGGKVDSSAPVDNYEIYYDDAETGEQFLANVSAMAEGTVVTVDTYSATIVGDQINASNDGIGFNNNILQSFVANDGVLTTQSLNYDPEEPASSVTISFKATGSVGWGTGNAEDVLKFDVYGMGGEHEVIILDSRVNNDPSFEIKASDYGMTNIDSVQVTAGFYTTVKNGIEEINGTDIKIKFGFATTVETSTDLEVLMDFTARIDDSDHDFALVDFQVGTLVDGIVEGLAYTTSSGMTGFTDANGHFNYQNGESVSFSIGSVVLGIATAEDLASGQVFLQDMADVSRTDLNDEYLENMAVLLQSLDSDSGDNILISQSMHDAFSDDNFDLQTLSETDLVAIIEENGIQVVSEEEAMEHVQDMLIEYTDLEAGDFDEHTADNPLDEADIFPAAYNVEDVPEPLASYYTAEEIPVLSDILDVEEDADLGELPGINALEDEEGPESVELSNNETEQQESSLDNSLLNNDSDMLNNLLTDVDDDIADV